MMAVTLALARLVFEPSSPVVRSHDESVLLIQRHAANLGCEPGLPDAGVPDGAVDAGTEDAGVDAGAPDAGCEPIVGDAVTMVVRPRFDTAVTGARFALLFVTPSRPVVETVDDPFPSLEAITKPKTEVQIVEVVDPSLGKQCGGGGGCGFGAYSDDPGTTFIPPELGDGGVDDGPPTVETVGPYEIVRVQPADPDELQVLLASFNYRVQPEDVAALAPYISAGYSVVAVRVGEQAGTTLAPLAMTWPGTELRLPFALDDRDTAGITAYVAADGRYEFPGGLVSYAGRTFGGETSYLTRIDIGVTDSEAPSTDPIATRVPDDDYQIVNVVQEVKRVPQTQCLDVDVGCCDSSGPRADFGVLLVGVAFMLRRKRATASR